MSSAITWFFKEIFPEKADFERYMTEYEIADLSIIENLNFADYLYKIMFRRFHNSNIQYDTTEDFKLDLANLIEDVFEKYKKQLKIINLAYDVSNEELEEISQAIANNSLNPNTKVNNPKAPLEYISAQAFTVAKTNKLQAYMNSLNLMPTKLIKSFLTDCQKLFKAVIPNQFILFDHDKYDIVKILGEEDE